MFIDDANYYRKVFKKAESGDPFYMFRLAKLYDSGAINSASDSEYVFWLKKFMESDPVKAIVSDLDVEDATYDIGASFSEVFELYQMIIEAGIDLGLYYMNSSDVKEVKLARDSLYSAWLASKCDYIEVEVSNSVVDIVNLLRIVNERVEFISERFDDDV